MSYIDCASYSPIAEITSGRAPASVLISHLGGELAWGIIVNHDAKTWYDVKVKSDIKSQFMTMWYERDIQIRWDKELASNDTVLKLTPRIVSDEQ